MGRVREKRTDMNACNNEQQLIIQQRLQRQLHNKTSITLLDKTRTIYVI